MTWVWRRRGFVGSGGQMFLILSHEVLQLVDVIGVCWLERHSLCDLLLANVVQSCDFSKFWQGVLQLGNTWCWCARGSCWGPELRRSTAGHGTGSGAVGDNTWAYSQVNWPRDNTKYVKSCKGEPSLWDGYLSAIWHAVKHMWSMYHVFDTHLWH